MCGIVGYIGREKDPRVGLDLLSRLEYRGYDSSGMAVWDKKKKKIEWLKATGKIVNLKKKFEKNSFQGSPAIFHTRWATHGGVTEENAHPHFGCSKNIFLVHNGIIENYKVLKTRLEKEGHKFTSETDTEVLAHLVEKFFEGNLEEALKKAFKLVEGTYGLAACSAGDPGKIVAARNSSPVLVGLGEEENLVASDASAIISKTKRVIYLKDGEMAILTPGDVVITDLNLNARKKLIKEIEWEIEDAQKSGFPHFMLKEIFEEPKALQNTLRGRLVSKKGEVRLGGAEEVEKELEAANRLTLSACGTSYFASLAGKYILEEVGRIPTEAAYAPEFRYRKRPLEKGTVFMAVSQSGETADTLAALGKAEEAGLLTMGIVNVVGSSIARKTQAGTYLHAGPEISVASTKAFICQLAALTLYSLFWGRKRGLSRKRAQMITEELEIIPEKIELILEKSESIKKLAERYARYDNFYYIGRKYNYPVALEGALKLKEISYIHAEGYEAAEMKHGPIALIDEDFPTFALCPQDSVYGKTVSNIEEIKARGGRVLALATEGDEKIKKIADDVLYVPSTLEVLSPLLNVVPLQLFAYYAGVAKGFDVDKPRNLAKSVTVE